MDEYLSEKEQIQHIRDWWRDNGWYLIGGVVIGVVGILGYGRYQDYVAGDAAAAGALYRQLEAAAGDDNMGEVDRLLAALRAEHEDSPYTDHAALLAARMSLVRDTERAVAELRSVMDSEDPDLAMVARLRLARVLAYQEKYDEALALLDVAAAGPFAARISEIRGDIHVAMGDREAARAAFTTALVAEGAELLDRNFVQMKLGDLQIPDSPAAPDAAPQDAGSQEPAITEDVAPADAAGAAVDLPVVEEQATDRAPVAEDQG